MQPSRLVAVIAGLLATLLAVPASAAPGQAPDDRPGRGGNPVAHCLPDREEDDDADDADEDDADDADDADEDDGVDEDGVEDDGTEDEGVDEDGTEGVEDDGSDDGTEDEGVEEDAAASAGTDDDPADESTEDDGTEDEGVEEDAEDGAEDDDADDADDADEADDDGSGPGPVAQCVLDSLPDIVGSPHAASVVAIVERGITNGKADGTYGTQDAVTRGQMATFLARALDLQPSEQATLPEDVDPDDVHADAIAAVIEEAIALGKTDGSFAPRDAVTRGQMAAFLSRALDLVEEAGGELPEDVRGSVHERAIEKLVDNGITNGFSDGTFRPGQEVTRGQMASFLDRALNL